ncbi:hypothetical protein BKP35_18280 [Anaerobacillus arseniciselenatis]|uniref:Uncharacterized protein n=1 Tax=Anaerobacillus arseniciselenatis TaxID=85682 RepID=A0A1S2L5Q0_9BACI|nr:hypothetical protein BKP35_18280 [Anaerobacillus arseniciselenatis]
MINLILVVIIAIVFYFFLFSVITDPLFHELLSTLFAENPITYYSLMIINTLILITLVFKFIKNLFKGLDV